MAVRYQVTGRIPDSLLRRVADGVAVPARGRPREAVVYLFPGEAADWAPYLRDLATRASELADWDGRVVALTSGPEGAWQPLARELGDRVWLVRDPDHALGPADEGRAPLAAVADRYGEIYHVWSDDDGPRPEPRELEEWLRFLALQCPE
jgi:hypothetical protein